MIAAGSTLEFVASGNVSTYSPVEYSPENLAAKITSDLLPYMKVERITVTPTTWALGGLHEYAYQAFLAVTTKQDHAKADDVGSIIAHAFYVNGGQLPTVVRSGSAYAPPPPDPDAADPFAWLKKIGTGVQSSVTMIAIAAIVLGVVILKDK